LHKIIKAKNQKKVKGVSMEETQCGSQGDDVAPGNKSSLVSSVKGPQTTQKIPIIIHNVFLQYRKYMQQAGFPSILPY
jgi:hypothetical protein